MSYNARNDEIRDNITRIRQAWAAERQRGVQCPRCNGHGRPRIIALSQHPSA